MKLPVFEIIGAAYRFVWQKRNAFWLLAIPAIVVLSILGSIATWSMWLAADGAVGNMQDALMAHADSAWPHVLNAANAVVYAIVFVMYSVAWHRLYLVPDEALPVREAYVWRRRQTQFLIAYLKIFGLLVVTVMVPAFVVGFVFVGIGKFFVLPLILCAVWFYARLSIILPAAAVDEYLTIKQVFELTQGNGWRLFWIIVLVAVPISVVSLPISLGIGLMTVKTGVLGWLTANLLIGLVNQFIGFLAVAITVSGLSISYRMLTGGNDSAVAER